MAEPLPVLIDPNPLLPPGERAICYYHGEYFRTFMIRVAARELNHRGTPVERALWRPVGRIGSWLRLVA